MNDGYQLWTSPDHTRSGVSMRRPAPDIEVFAPLKIRAHVGNEGKAAATDENGRLWVRSLASTPSIDEMDEIVEVRAFRDGLSVFAERPIMLAYHDMMQPVGLWPRQELSNEGLFLEGFISDGRPDIQRLVLDGVLGSSSIGFMVKDDGLEWDDELEVLRITALELYEVSLVPLPANRDTYVSVMDGFKDFARRKSIELKRRPKPSQSPPAEERRPERVSTVATPDWDRIGGCLAEVVALSVDLLRD